MTRIEKAGGTAYTGNAYDRPYEEVWSPTIHLRFIQQDAPVGPKMLYQLWQSNIGRTVWRPVPETLPSDIENG